MIAATSYHVHTTLPVKEFDATSACVLPNDGVVNVLLRHHRACRHYCAREAFC